MGQSLNRMGVSFGAHETSDLNDEQVEEIRMVTTLPEREIHRVRKKYRAHAAQEAMTKDEFFAIPGIDVNPLREQVFRLFELTADAKIPFLEFARFVAIYSYHSTQDAKLREAFRLHDVDGDGKISREDLRTYLSLTYPLALADGNESTEDAVHRQQETIANVVARVLEEASSDATQEFLVYEDFIKVVQATDFESRLIFPF